MAKNRANKHQGAFWNLWVIFIEIWGNDIYKLEVALFRLLGLRSSPNLVDWSPEIIDCHDLGICGTPGNLYLWIWIYQIGCKNPSKSILIFGRYEFPKSWNLKMEHFGKDACPEIPKIRLINSWTSWIWNWKSYQQIWNLGILRLWNFDICGIPEYLIPNTYSIFSFNSLINRPLMVNGSWLRGGGWGGAAALLARPGSPEPWATNQ